MKHINPYRYLIPFWKKEAAILSLSGLIMLLGLVNPYLAKLVIDRAYVNKDLGLFIALIAVGGIIFILNGTLGSLSNYLTRHIRMRLNLDLNRDIFGKLQRLPYTFFQDSSTGDHLYRISYDIEQASRFIADALPQAISLIPRTIGIFIIILCLNWRMAALALAFGPFLYVMPLYFNRRLKKAYKIWIESSQGVFKGLHEALSHMRLVKTFGRQRSEVRKYIGGLIKNIRFNLKTTKVETAGLFANGLANRVVLGLVVFYGGYQVIRGGMTLGALAAITIYLNQLSGLQGALTQFFQQVSLGMVSCGRLDVILAAKTGLMENMGAREISFSKNDVEFNGASFEYGPGKRVLINLNFRIRGGMSTALVGPSGCGKTTLVNLLLRLYALNSGRILIGGHDIRDVKSKSFYEQIGVVMQEPYLWNDTIENNIRYGRRSAGLNDIREASRIACADAFIGALPHGYETVIGENACKISEGQKQRIAIARAVIKKPKLLIMDEAMSSLDSETEDKIIANLRGALAGSTLIVISHRLSTVKKMDMVYFLEGPSAMRIGSHEDLLNNNPSYNELFAGQLEYDFSLHCRA